MSMYYGMVIFTYSPQLTLPAKVVRRGKYGMDSGLSSLLRAPKPLPTRSILLKDEPCI